MTIGIAVGAALWFVSALVFAAAFLGVVGAAFAVHRRNAARVHAGFLTWCAQRGLEHCAGRVSALHPSAGAQHADPMAAATLERAMGGRVTTSCQVRGRLWEHSGIGHLTLVSHGSRGRQERLEYLVVDVPMDETFPACAGADIGRPRLSDHSSIGRRVVEELAGAALPPSAGATVTGGRYVAWFASSHDLFLAARATARADGSAAPDLTAPTALDARLASVRDHFATVRSHHRTA